MLKRFKLYFKSLRPHQWSKNLLIAIPLIAAHQFQNVDRLKETLLAILSFSLAASAIYLINDLVDIQSDKAHPIKKNRPFASGRLSPRFGYFAVPILVLVSVLVSLLLEQQFTFYLAIYLFLTTLYSFFFKRMLLLDVLCLSSLYSIRIMAGGAAADVPVSKWLLSFSMFLFFGLALLKRAIEIRDMSAQKGLGLGRGYVLDDYMPVMIAGIGSGLLSTLVFTFYINSPEVSVLYRQPEVLWLIPGLLLFWISRLWILANRGKVHDDPVIFALKDVGSYVLAAFILGIALWAM